MCVTCKIPLELAQSPQADRERALIAELIGRGYDEAQIKHELVAQYGPSVLALPQESTISLLRIPAGTVYEMLERGDLHPVERGAQPPLICCNSLSTGSTQKQILIEGERQ